MYLNKETVTKLPDTIKKNKAVQRPPAAVMHFGVGGFHRSHQAYALQQLLQLDPVKYAEWSICGICIMPSDKAFVERVKQQDLLYSLRICASGTKEEVMVVDAITELLFGPEQQNEIIHRIAAASTKLISFTITEGGYNIDEASGAFNLQQAEILNDLQPANAAKTVFGFLARGLQKRMSSDGGPITLLSCDNIQGNGDVLKLALYSFVNAYDASLITYLDQQVSFPNCMVDRITPVTTAADRALLETAYGYKDDCLVVCEPFFQWVIEKEKNVQLPPLELVGVDLVEDVKAYESMKLRILNGGHSLTGLTGKAMGYQFIHDAVQDPTIAVLFDLYNVKEVHPSLEPLPGVDYAAYAAKVKSRFANALINDSTDRIISGSTAKIPKFVLPVIQHQVSKGIKPVTGALIVAAWWHYLDTQIGSGTAIDDPAAPEWKQLFRENADDTLSAFLGKQDLFGELSLNTLFCEQVQLFAALIRKHDMLYACEQAIKSLQ
ncbi:mannitol dehydrogenase family protein [Pseudobacter ginsenosidimutans]|uniref:Mannitol 2-dehydrogenase n=1 Tax=Pseudobacter ginsenosidimutans TaxID=661488 RepID=A0A4Q7M9R2_9BACT|nr:mannitol dehydrogenase family protein [Pseudobacter ginsenosidimutans]QEC42568.1 mannitol dehydrogenase family protein [Pseudobacter ginsenosidimutans]RZS63943.1 mannitol 2-dehydrogenase [Pseudobacter ginsenosidimutans]